MYQAAKQLAAQRAVELVSHGMCVGLGTGSTAALFIEELGKAIASGALTDITGVPTSIDSQRLATQHGIPLADLSNGFYCDLTIDGADEIDPQLELIKGLGGALLREKVVAQNSRRVVIIADASKRVARLGTKSPLPVEVLPFARGVVEKHFAQQGLRPKPRLKPDGRILHTDNGNIILDCSIDHVTDIRQLAKDVTGRAGVVGHGLFIGLADLAIIADLGGQVELLSRMSCG
jgi:ribose 5-phosphate isomerase A